MEYYFESDDKLNRLRYAEFLKSLLENCDKYRREDSEGAYVIAIDSPWGTGKTRFVKMLRNFLENRKSDTPAESPIDPSNGFLTVYYNAWDTDFSTDALEPLVYSLINSREFESDLFEQQADEEIKEFIGTAKKVLKVIGLSASHHFLGETATKVFETCLENEDKSNHDDCGFKKKRQAILDFRDTLSRVIAKTKNEKLVIIIDELDRCRPTFAIQTLELAKHLFAIDGLIFIFALDIKQLSCSVKTIYGQELDAPGYLCRFFDYITQLPLPDKRKIIEEKIANLERKGFFSLATPLTSKNTVSYEITEFILNIATTDNLSIRELLALLSHYEILIVTFLRNYNSEIPFLLYFFFLYLKLKHHDIFNLIFTNSQFNIKKWEQYLRDRLGSVIDERVILQKLVFLNRKDKIGAIEFTITDSNTSDYASSNKGVIVNSVKKIDAVNFDGIQVNCATYHNGIRGSTNYTYDKNSCFDQILFYNDIISWDSIKELTLPEFYQQQLEMFNFALPSDNSESKA